MNEFRIRNAGISKASRQKTSGKGRQGHGWEGGKVLQKGRRGLNLQRKPRIAKKAAKNRVPLRGRRIVVLSNVPKS